MTDPGLLEAAASLREGRLTSLALTERLLERAAWAQARTNCFLRLDAAAARKAALQADERLGAAREAGVDLASTQPLLGVPLAHKDMFVGTGSMAGAAIGLSPSCGSRVPQIAAHGSGDLATDGVARVAAAVTSTALARLEAAGAHAIGALNMAEFALGATGHNASFGDCRNAWQPEFIAGGSSSGSGAAVACGATPASLGSDTGGSVRIPAAVNGVLGLKPTYGLLPRTGSMKLSPSIDTLGPIARSAADLAAVLQIIAGADGRDALASRRMPPDYAAALGRGVEGLRIGLPRNHFFGVATPEVRAAMERCLAALEGAGARIVEVTVPDAAPLAELSRVIVYSEATALHAPQLRAHAARYTPQVRVRASTGLAIPGTTLLEALRLRLPLLRRFVGEVFSRCDVLHTPTLPIGVPRRDETDVGGGAAMWEILAKLVHCTAPFNYLGVPAIAVPAGLDVRGLPLSAQFVARPFAEATLLRIAAAQQRLLPMPAAPLPASPAPAAR
jgi:aspartyl-tRNA(Asn)/glutamyl-tRNA(Gln) amidotransferase subunit A